MPPAVQALLILAGLYTAACAIWPHTACTRCDGAGKLRSPSGKTWRRCRRCAGTGDRERFGARLLRRRSRR